MFVLNFNLKGWIYYPESVRNMIKKAHRANFYRDAIREKYDNCKFGEEKNKLYMTLIDIQRLCDCAKKKVEFCEILKLDLFRYVRAEDKVIKEFREELDLAEKSVESEFTRIEKTYYELKREEI